MANSRAPHPHPQRNGAILMPAERPVGAWSLVEQDGADRLGCGAEMGNRHAADLLIRAKYAARPAVPLSRTPARSRTQAASTSSISSSSGIAPPWMMKGAVPIERECGRHRPLMGKAATGVNPVTSDAAAGRAGRPSCCERLRARTSGAGPAYSFSVSSGTTLNRSPTSPRSATWKIGASSSLLIAMIVLESFMPARCWIAPEMPTAT